MKKFGAMLVGMGLSFVAIMSMAAYTGWNYNPADLQGANSLQARLDEIDNRLDAIGATSATDALTLTNLTAVYIDDLAVPTAVDGTERVFQEYQLTIGAGGAVTQTWTTAFSVKPKVFGAYAEATTTLVTNFYCVATTTNLIVTGEPSKKVDILAYGAK